MGLRPMKSDVEDHTKRPPMLNSDSRPTKPAAVAAATVEVSQLRKKSWIIGAACSRMPMPAVKLPKRTGQRSQDCGVLRAVVGETISAVTRALFLITDGAKTSGRQSECGPRVVEEPYSMQP